MAGCKAGLGIKLLQTWLPTSCPWGLGKSPFTPKVLAGLGEALGVTCWRVSSPSHYGYRLLGVFLPHTLRGRALGLRLHFSPASSHLVSPLSPLLFLMRS